jgi:hypothetical protein
VSLPIQKSTAKNRVAADSEIGSDGGVISALLLYLFFFVFTIMDGDIIQLKCDIKVISLV